MTATPSRRQFPTGPVPLATRTDGRLTVPAGTLAYTLAGSGEPLLLIHGLGNTRETWHHVIDSLAATHTVIAPDLPGHGDSEPPAGDYSLGAHAAILRDLLVALGHTWVTIIGHSLGGGVGLQFAYQFPDRVSRIVLISSGGLGAELSPMLRAAILPGAETVIAGLGQLPTALTRRVLPLVSLLPGVVARQDARPIAQNLRDMADPAHRRTFVRTARAVINWRGQAVTAARQYELLTDVPLLIAWGSNDRTIPPHHHQSLAARLPDAHVVEIDRAGHFPHVTDPEELLPAIHAFLRSTSPFRYDEDRLRDRLTRMRDAPSPESPPSSTTPTDPLTGSLRDRPEAGAADAPTAPESEPPASLG